MSSLTINDSDELAAIEYHGVAGSTSDCLYAVERILHFGDWAKHALILTSEQPKIREHALLLTNEIGDQIAVKSGFASGYGGEGPVGFSIALGLFEFHKCKLEEKLVERAFLERLDASALTRDDLERLENVGTVRPRRLYDYIQDAHYPLKSKNNLWNDRRAFLPLAIIDPRLSDFALTFWDNPDIALMQGHRRLETIVKQRIELPEQEAARVFGAKLYSRAFAGDDSKLNWPNLSDGEKQGRVQLFVGTVQAHRNSRAHRERAECGHEQLSEFLLLNHLYRLEALAKSTADDEES